MKNLNSGGTKSGKVRRESPKEVNIELFVKLPKQNLAVKSIKIIFGEETYDKYLICINDIVDREIIRRSQEKMRKRLLQTLDEEIL